MRRSIAAELVREVTVLQELERLPDRLVGEAEAGVAERQRDRVGLARKARFADGDRAVVGAERAKELFESAYDEHARRLALLYQSIGAGM